MLGPKDRASVVVVPGLVAPMADLRALSRQTPLRALSRQTPLRALSRQTPLRALSRQTPLRALSRQTPLRALSRQTPRCLFACLSILHQDKLLIHNLTCSQTYTLPA